MARFLYANYFTWNHSNNLQLGGSIPGPFTTFLSIDGEAVSSSSADTGAIQATDGFFVGMIMHVGSNTQGGGSVKFDIEKVTKLSGYVTRTILGNITVPAGEVGCFYSNPDTLESTRSFTKYDNLRMKLSKVSGDGGGGPADVTLMIGLETTRPTFTVSGDDEFFENNL